MDRAWSQSFTSTYIVNAINQLSITPISPQKEKKRKRRDEVDRAFEAAAATHDAGELRRVQSRTFEAMFETLFRIVKACCGVAGRGTGEGVGWGGLGSGWGSEGKWGGVWEW